MSKEQKEFEIKNVYVDIEDLHTQESIKHVIIQNASV